MMMMKTTHWKLKERILARRYPNTGDVEDNSLYGDAGADIIKGGSGSDSIVGGSGSDTLSGGLGEDFIYGNLDTNPTTQDGNRDVVDYTDSATGIKLNLHTTQTAYTLSEETSATFVAATSTGEGTDKLYDIQDVIGSNQADTIIGDENTNIILGLANNDILYGGIGSSISDTP